MIVTNVNILYVCDNCKMPYAFKFALKTIASLTDVTKHMAKTKECTVCKGQMSIRHAIFKVIESDDEYGDVATGSWRCPFHTTFVYYPQTLRKAVDGTLHIVTTGQILYQRYLKIASMKYPWKCPLCAELLKYRTDKYNYIS